MKHYFHLLAPLIMWIIGVILYAGTINNEIPKKIDAVHTYQIVKKPISFADAWYSIRDSFSRHWPDDTCYTPTYFAPASDCNTKRNTLATEVIASMDCDKYVSQSCSCIKEILKGVRSSTNSSIGKNLAGRKDSTLYALESCRWLMHNTHVLVSSNKVWAQRTAIVLLILTLITGNAADWVVVNPFTAPFKDNMSKAMVKIITIFFWGMLALAITVTVENNTFALFLLILLPPVVLLALYEIYLPMYHFDHRPFLHPYFFTTILGALTLLGLVEAGVSDFDVIVFEILKCNVAAFVYLQLVWKYMLNKSHINEVDFAQSNYVEDGTLRSAILITGLYLVGLWAPYPTTTTNNLMWFAPFMWVLISAASVVWVSSFEYNSWFGGNVKKNQPKSDKEGENGINSALAHVSALVMIFGFLILMYYLRENATIYRVLVDKYPTRAIQYNSSATWARAPTIR